jgi:hypothetical protein
MSTKEYGARARPFYEELIVRNPDGSTGGRDPRKLPKSLLEKAFSRQSVLKSVRAKCLDCCCYQVGEIAKCTAVGCPLWPLRMGSNPLTRRTGNPSSLRNSPPEAEDLQQKADGRPDSSKPYLDEKPLSGTRNSRRADADHGSSDKVADAPDRRT